MRTAVLIGLLALAVPVADAADAAVYRLDPAASTISFTYLENGTPKTGHFARLDGEAVFDARALEATDVSLTIPAKGVDLGDRLRSHFAQSVDWFDAAAHPTFTVRLRRLVAIGPGRYRAEGVVAIKGHEIGIAPELLLSEEAGGLRASGTLLLDRHDYRLGVGFSSLFATVATEVEVRFSLVGRPAR